MWTSDLSVWQKSLASYIAAISERQHQKNKSGLAELDAFVQKELPSAIASRSPPHITSAEYSRVVQWKLKRGKWRPRLQAFADATTPCEVKEASQHAFSHLRNGQTKTALNTLTALKGCGPATASAILAAADPSIPFMSDELLTMTQGPKRSYTIKVCYLTFPLFYRSISHICFSVVLPVFVLGLYQTY